MFWSRNFYVETGLSGHWQNSCWRRTASGRDADRKESLEQSVEIIGKTGRKKKVVGMETKKGRIGMKETIKNRYHSQNGKRGQRSAVRRWASGPSLTHTVFLSSASFSLHSLNGIPLCSQITVFVYILKTKKKKPRHAGKRRRPKGVEWPACPRWENKTGVVGFILESLQILVRNFYVKNTGISAFFT